MYADDVCIMASNEQHLQTIFDFLLLCVIKLVFSIFLHISLLYR